MSDGKKGPPDWMNQCLVMPAAGSLSLDQMQRPPAAEPIVDDGSPVAGPEKVQEQLHDELLGAVSQEPVFPPDDDDSFLEDPSVVGLALWGESAAEFSEQDAPRESEAEPRMRALPFPEQMLSKRCVLKNLDLSGLDWTGVSDSYQAALKSLCSRGFVMGGDREAIDKALEGQGLPRRRNAETDQILFQLFLNSLNQGDLNFDEFLFLLTVTHDVAGAGQGFTGFSGLPELKKACVSYLRSFYPDYLAYKTSMEAALQSSRLQYALMRVIGHSLMERFKYDSTDLNRDGVQQLLDKELAYLLSQEN